MSLSKMRFFFTTAIAAAVLVVGCTEQNKSYLKETKVKEVDLSQYEDSKPERKMRLLFIHHSVGGQWLADKGDEKRIVADTTIYEYHPNGGGLRSLMERNNYEIHEASYKSVIGDKTDVCNWNTKFRDMMDAILRCDRQDQSYKDPSVKNDVVMFKSCFPNSAILSEGNEPGDPDAAEKTTANYKTAYTKLLGFFRNHPDTLFVCVTAPPLVGSIPSRTREMIKKMMGSGTTVNAVGERARRFNNWLKDPENGWLKGYQGNNVVVFDYYDVLTGHGKSNHAFYPTQGGADSHPNAEGNSIAAREFVPFLNRAAHRISAGK